MVKALCNSFNKVQVRLVGVSALSTSEVHPLPLGYHGGGGRRRLAVACGEAEELQGIHGAISSGRSFSVALVWLPTHDAVGRLIQMLMRWGQAFNLLRRPSILGFASALFFHLRPSGFVPGPAPEGHRASPQFTGGCGGPDCVSSSIFKVLYAYVEVQFIIDSSVVDLFVIYTTPLLSMRST
jgi:hypothetical protein